MLLEIRSGAQSKDDLQLDGRNILGLLYGRLTNHEDDNIPSISKKSFLKDLKCFYQKEYF